MLDRPNFLLFTYGSISSILRVQNRKDLAAPTVQGLGGDREVHNLVSQQRPSRCVADLSLAGTSGKCAGSLGVCLFYRKQDEL